MVSAVADPGSGEPQPLDLPGDPNTLRMVLLEDGGDNAHRVVLTYFDKDQKLRCFEKKTNAKWSWYRCNDAHALGTAVLLPDGSQLSLEQRGVGAVRRYPSEGKFGARDRRTQARAAGAVTVRWEVGEAYRPSEKSAPDVRFASGEDVPWDGSSGGVIRSNGKRLVASATLSPDGGKLAWIEERATRDHRELVPAVDPEMRPYVKLVRTMDTGARAADGWQKPQLGGALAVAVDKSGRIAQVQAGQKGASVHLVGIEKPLLELPPYDPPYCLVFSPNGEALVLGTSGGTLYRFDTRSGDGAKTALRRSDAGRAYAAGRPEGRLQSLPVPWTTTAASLLDTATERSGSFRPTPPTAVPSN